MILGRLTKLDNLANPHHFSTAVDCNQFEEGTASSEPAPGKRFYLFDESGARLLIGTSIVKSVWKLGSDDQDGLVLPSTFPATAREITLPEDADDGDIVFATLNSLYWFKPDKPRVANSTTTV